MGQMTLISTDFTDRDAASTAVSFQHACTGRHAILILYPELVYEKQLWGGILSRSD